MRTLAVRTALTCLLLLLVACEGTQLRSREKGALGGAALGAGLGAIVGNQTGSTGAGIAIGSAIGALSGALIGNEIDNSNAALDERESRIAENQRRIDENRILIQELSGKGIDARVTDRGVVVNMPDVLFEFGSYRLTSYAFNTVSDIADVVNRSGGRHVSVEGHTDSIGSNGYNQRLSQDRARSVANELTRDGVARNRMSVRGYGESRPVASNSTPSGRQQNRRVEVVIEN